MLFYSFFNMAYCSQHEKNSFMTVTCAKMCYITFQLLCFRNGSELIMAMRGLQVNEIGSNGVGAQSQPQSEVSILAVMEVES